MQTVPFPVDRLVPLPGTISFNEFGASIELPLARFELEQHGPVETAIRIDCIRLQVNSLADLAGQIVYFSRNPADDAPEGSIYILRHHPADLLSMRFNSVSRDRLEAEIEVEVVFSFEGLAAGETREYEDTRASMCVVLDLIRPANFH